MVACLALRLKLVFQNSGLGIYYVFFICVMIYGQIGGTIYYVNLLNVIKFSLIPDLILILLSSQFTRWDLNFAQVGR